MGYLSGRSITPSKLSSSLPPWKGPCDSTLELVSCVCIPEEWLGQVGRKEIHLWLMVGERAGVEKLMKCHCLRHRIYRK